MVFLTMFQQSALVATSNLVLFEMVRAPDEILDMLKTLITNFGSRNASQDQWFDEPFHNEFAEERKAL